MKIVVGDHGQSHFSGPSYGPLGYLVEKNECVTFMNLDLKEASWPLENKIDALLYEPRAQPSPNQNK